MSPYEVSVDPKLISEIRNILEEINVTPNDVVRNQKFVLQSYWRLSE